MFHRENAKSVKVSFVVAMYNVAAYIEECVRSLFEQTLDDIEIIIVNDCSSDNSLEIVLRTLEEYPNRKEQVRVVQHEQNTGIKTVRKDGVYQARGEYVINVDGDDYTDIHMAETMYSKAKESDADMVLCGFWKYTREGRYYVFPVPEESLSETETIKDAVMNRYGWLNVWCRMIKREVLLDERMIWPTVGHAEDVIISMAATYIAKKIVGVSEPLYHYRFTFNSITNDPSATNRLKKYHEYVKNNETLFSFFQKYDIADKYQRGIIVSKMRAKNELLALLPDSKYHKMWLKTYPEVNRIMLFGNSIFPSTYREKVWFLGVALGLYPKYKRRLLSKRFRPEFTWRYIPG